MIWILGLEARDKKGYKWQDCLGSRSEWASTVERGPDGRGLKHVPHLTKDGESGRNAPRDFVSE